MLQKLYIPIHYLKVILFPNDVGAGLLDIQLKQADSLADNSWQTVRRHKRSSPPISPPAGRHLDLQDTQLDEFLYDDMSAADLLRQH